MVEAEVAGKAEVLLGDSVWLRCFAVLHCAEESGDRQGMGTLLEEVGKQCGKSFVWIFGAEIVL